MAWVPIKQKPRPRPLRQSSATRSRKNPILKSPAANHHNTPTAAGNWQRLPDSARNPATPVTANARMARQYSSIPWPNAIAVKNQNHRPNRSRCRVALKKHVPQVDFAVCSAGPIVAITTVFTKQHVKTLPTASTVAVKRGVCGSRGNRRKNIPAARS